MEIETPVLLAYAIEDSTDIFRISGGGGGLNTPNPPLSVRHWISTSKYLHIVLSILFSVYNLTMANRGPKHVVIASLPTLFIKYLLCLWLPFPPFYNVVDTQPGCRTLKLIITAHLHISIWNHCGEQHIPKKHKGLAQKLQALWS